MPDSINGQTVQVRLPGDLQERIEQFRRSSGPVLPSLSETIRYLIEQGLAFGENLDRRQ